RRGLPGPRLKKFGSSKSVKRKSLESLGWRMMSSPPQRHDIAADLRRGRQAELRPLLHQLPPLGDHVGAAIGTLDLGADIVGQADLDGVGAVRSLLVTPIAEGGAKPVNRSCALLSHAAHDPRQRRMV